MSTTRCFAYVALFAFATATCRNAPTSGSGVTGETSSRVDASDGGPRTKDDGTRSLDAPLVLDAPTATAALRSILTGYGIAFESRELSKQCKVDDAGASIDDLEDVAAAYGLVAEQRLMPLDELCADAMPLPAIVITGGDAGSKEFVNVWRRRGKDMQVMDPQSGVSWQPCDDLQRAVYVHDMDVGGRRMRGLVAVVILGRRPAPRR